MRVFMVFVLAITAGGALAFGTYNYVQHLPTKTTSFPTRPVIVAANVLGIGADDSIVKIEDSAGHAVPIGGDDHRTRRERRRLGRQMLDIVIGAEGERAAGRNRQHEHHEHTHASHKSDPSFTAIRSASRPMR